MSIKTFYILFLISTVKLILPAGAKNDMTLNGIIDEMGRVINSKDPVSYTNIEKMRNLRKTAINQSKKNSLFLKNMRHRLRKDKRKWVRSFCATTLIEAFGTKGKVEDYIYILSDPDVRGFGIIGSTVYKIDDVSSCVAVGLLSNNPDERLATIKSIEVNLGWKGFPYYSALLDDNNQDVAIEAAKAFRLCHEEDAITRLTQYVETHSVDNNREAVVSQAKKILKAFEGPGDTQKAPIKTGKE